MMFESNIDNGIALCQAQILRQKANKLLYYNAYGGKRHQMKDPVVGLRREDEGMGDIAVRLR